MKWATEILWQVPPFLAGCLVIKSIGLRKIRSSFNGPMAALSHTCLVQWRYLGAYVACMLLLLVLSPMRPLRGDRTAPSSLLSPAHIVSMSVSVVAVVVLFAWIFDFIGRAREELAQERYPAGTRLQDIAWPFLWRLYLLELCLGVPGFIFGVLSGRSGAMSWYSFPTRLLYVLVFPAVEMGFVFMMATRGYTMIDSMLRGFGLAVLVNMAFHIVSGALPRVTADSQATGQLAGVRPVWEMPMFYSVVALLGWYFLWRFEHAKPRQAGADLYERPSP